METDMEQIEQSIWGVLHVHGNQRQGHGLCVEAWRRKESSQAQWGVR